MMLFRKNTLSRTMPPESPLSQPTLTNRHQSMSVPTAFDAGMDSFMGYSEDDTSVVMMNPAGTGVVGGSVDDTLKSGTSPDLVIEEYSATGM